MLIQHFHSNEFVYNDVYARYLYYVLLFELRTTGKLEFAPHLKGYFGNLRSSLNF